MRTRPFTKSAGNRPDILRNGRRSRSTVPCGKWFRYEVGVKRPSVENLTKLADVLADRHRRHPGAEYCLKFRKERLHVHVQLMTLCELVERLRSLGVPTSNTKAAAMIEAGQYPFASCVRLKEDGERVFEISKVLFDKWVAERVVPQPGDPGYRVPLELCPQHTTQEAS